MKAIIKESWAKATGRKTDIKSRTFNIIEKEHNLIGSRGFDTFLTLEDNLYNGQWVIAGARIESIIEG